MPYNNRNNRNNYRGGRRGGRYIPRSRDKYSQMYNRNNYIRAREVRVISEDKENLGVMPTNEALQRAQDLGLDLVEIVPHAKPPVCRIIDWQKFKYELQQKEKEQKKKQRHNKQKELVIKSTIDTGDLNRKLRKLDEFLEEGRQVKITVQKRRRQHIDEYRKFKDELLTKLAEHGNIVSSQDQRHRLTAILNQPTKQDENGKKDKESTNKKDKSDS